MEKIIKYELTEFEVRKLAEFEAELNALTSRVDDEILRNEIKRIAGGLKIIITEI